MSHTRRSLHSALVVALLSVAMGAGAQVGCPTIQPSTDASAAPTVEAGFCVAGTLDRNRRYMRWNVPAGDARTVWKMRVTGTISAPVLLKVVALERDAAGTESATQTQFTLQPPSLAATGELSGLLLQSGAYLLALVASDPVPFRIEAVRAFSVAEAAAELTSKGAVAVKSRSKVVVEPFVIDAPGTRRRWQIELFAPPTARGTIEVRDSADTILLRRSTNGGAFVLHDLALPEGRYQLRYDLWDADASVVMRLVSDGPRVPTRESEPNDTPRTAEKVALARTFDARAGEPGDVDVFRIEPPAATQLEVRADGNGGELELCLLGVDERPLQCRTGTSPQLPQLVLAGVHYVSARGSDGASASYRLSVRATGRPADGSESEPNDTGATALPVEPSTARHGRLVGADTDAYTLVARGEPGLWEIGAKGSGITELWIADRDGTVVGRTVTDRRSTAAALVLRDTFLAPAPYTLFVKGLDGEYVIDAQPKGKPDLRMEREPNTHRTPNRLRPGSERIGWLSDADDRDTYRFSLAASTHVALTLSPPAGASIDMEIEWGWPALRRPSAQRISQPTTYSALLDPGDYLVRLRPTVTSDATYTLALVYADPFVLPGDLEPNDSPSQARAFPATGRVESRVGDFSDEDWFALPVVDSTRKATFRVTGGATLQVMDGDAEVPLATSDDRATVSFEVPAKRALTLGVRGQTAYGLDGRIDGIPVVADANTSLPASIALTLASRTVAAYWIRAQRVSGKALLTSTSNTPLELTLDAATSHVAYSVNLSRNRVTLPPNTSLEVPFVVVVAPDARAEIDALIAIRARSNTGAHATARLVVQADTQSAPVSEVREFALPAALLGGFNVASPAYGGRARADQNPDDARREAVLFDGFNGEGFTIQADTAPMVITRILGGNEAWPIAGINLHPQVADRLAPAEQLRKFELLLADDGETFTPALVGELSMLPIEQAFVLSTPREAKAAQLRLVANHAANLGKIGLNEWQVITTPSPARLRGVSLDAADPDRGGHVVWSTPAAGTSLADLARTLSGIGNPLTVDTSPDQPPRFAVGFRDGRAIRIVRIVWNDAGPPAAPARLFGNVRVSASMDGPLGPWRDLGALKPPRAGADATLELADGAWARYLRFAAPAASATQTTRWVFPAKLSILERAIGAEGPSALAEWGLYSRAAAYEAGEPAPAPVSTAPASTSREKPAVLSIGQDESGVVEHAVREDWYRLHVPAGLRTLRVTLNGEPTIDADLQVTEEASKKDVSARVVEQAATRIVFDADVAPDTDLLLRVHEPARSVVVAYDTSASLSQYASFVRQAIAAYAEGIQPTHEFMNVMNFEEPFLLKEFSDQPWVVQGALAEVTAEGYSSNLEATMLPVMDGLARRKGARAAILVTDAESGGYALQGAMWALLDQLQPHVFVAHLGLGSDMRTQTGLLQDLTAVSGGVYSRAMAQADLDVVAERAAAWLRRPVRYRLRAEAAPASSGISGAIRIVAQPAPSPASPAVSAPSTRNAIEIVLDASGSMLQRLEGKRRIEIAQRVLNDVLRDAVADNSTVALRVFGDDKPGSCETRLAVPPAPLDRTAMAQLLSRIVPQNGARTPIGASLAAVAQDLAQVDGRRTIVLITDGEETCGGEPQAEIEKLAAAGLEVRVNIVGFAVNDAALRSEFQAWAQAGNGRYFDAAKPADLTQALAKAVGKEFRILDRNGVAVAGGVIGSPAIPLHPGRYSVEVDGSIAFEDVPVRPGETTALTWRE